MSIGLSHTSITVAAAALTMSLAAGLTARAQGPTPDERVAALKQSLADNQKRIRQYEWVETTIISLKGEEKARKQSRVYYGADGKLTKVPMGAPPAKQESSAQGRGRRGGAVKEKIIENKKDELQEYMEQASALIHKYVPPDAARVQAAKDAKKLTVKPGAQGQATLTFVDFVQPGDRLGIDVDAAASRLLGLNVATYLDKPEDTVTLNVRMASLADGTGYTAQTTLEAAAKNIKVVIENGGHRPLAR